MVQNYCVCCGEEIPEGRQICLICERKDQSPITEEARLYARLYTIYQEQRWKDDEKKDQEKE